MVAAVSPDAAAAAASLGVDSESNASGGAALGGDSPARKKRRSWKQHRVEAMDVSYMGVGVAGLRRSHDLYACDQCDKMFGKQSSLARHKYEHSGTTRCGRQLVNSSAVCSEKCASLNVMFQNPFRYEIRLMGKLPLAVCTSPTLHFYPLKPNSSNYYTLPYKPNLHF